MNSRWYGKIGFGVTQEVKKGIWKPLIEERNYYGNIISYRKNETQQNNSTNNEITINAKISVLDDGYLSSNYTSIIYIEFMGTRWRVSEVLPEYPRLTFTLGGVYNDNTN